MTDFNWNDLRTFLTVVRTGRLTAAAVRLGVEHSTLSRKIKGLEEALQTRLFDRRPSGYVLTEAGSKLVAEAEAVESLMIRITAQIAEPSADMAGSVRIGSPEGFGTQFLARHLHRLLSRHPALEIEFIANPHGVSLTKREADIAITMSRPEAARLKARKLCDYELGLYASQNHIEARGLPETIDDVARGRIIGYIPGLLPTPYHDYLPEFFGAREPDLRISNVLTQLQATLAGNGYCILPAFMADEHAELVRLLPSQIRVTRAYWLVMHPEPRAPAHVRATTDFLYAIVRENRHIFMPTARIASDGGEGM